MLLRKQAQNKFLDVKTEKFTCCNKITSNLILSSISQRFSLTSRNWFNCYPIFTKQSKTFELICCVGHWTWIVNLPIHKHVSYKILATCIKPKIWFSLSKDHTLDNYSLVMKIRKLLDFSKGLSCNKVMLNRIWHGFGNFDVNIIFIYSF